MLNSLWPRDACGAEGDVLRSAVQDDARDVDQGLDVVDHGRLAVEAHLHGERRLLARLSPLALDGFEQRGLLAADVGATATPDLDVEGEARAHDVRSQVPSLARLCDGVRHACLGQRVLAADVEEPALGTGGEACDRHRFHEAERILLEDRAVLERARLGLVRVADDVLGGAGCCGHRGPLPPGGEGGTAAPLDLGGDDLLHRPTRPHLDGHPERAVAAVGAEVREAGRVDAPDAGQEAKARVAGLRDEPAQGRRDVLERVGCPRAAQAWTGPPWPGPPGGA